MTTSKQIEIVLKEVASAYNTTWQEVRHSEMAVYILSCSLTKRTLADTIHLPLPFLNELLKVWNDTYSHIEYYQKAAQEILAMIEPDATVAAA